MKLPFLNRATELKKIQKLLNSREPLLAVVYGRRRCGKSRLLQQLNITHTVYYLADQSDQVLQRRALAKQIEQLLPGFSDGTYNTWESLFNAMNTRNHDRKKKLTLILDEFPYLVTEDPAIPSMIQKMIDTEALNMHLVLCGSSQRMMKSLLFDETSPLYGRAREIVKIRPLKPGWIEGALKVKDREAIEHYSIWGGVPRYWELAAEFPDSAEAIRELVLNRDGILHNEPRRLLLDDMRTDTQPHSLLAIIGSGVHRISEMSSRLEKNSMNLLRPLDILIELDLVRREIPFGELEKNTKKTFYTIADPFLRFWYRFVYPNLSALEQELYDQVLESWELNREQFTSGVWEDLARESVPHLSILKKQWKQARRWWGKDRFGEMHEIDIVAESIDGSSILLGEAKWGNSDPDTICRKLEMYSTSLPFTKGKSVVAACWVGRTSRKKPCSTIITPDKVLAVLR